MLPRRRVPELMDDPALDTALHRQALAGLRRINRASLAASALWHTIRARLGPDANALRVLDLGCGAADVTLDLMRAARRDGRTDVTVDGCDASPRATAWAADAMRDADLPARTFTLDVLRDPLPDDYDVLTCTLFLHHLDDADAEALLARMGRAARRLVVVADLHRSRLGVALAWAGTRLLSRSPIVHVDGVRSARAAFTRDEAATMAAHAGLVEPRVERRWPCRWVLSARAIGTSS